MQDAQTFYGQRKGDVQINPALITLIDGRVGRETAATLQREVLQAAVDLLAAGIRTFHVDVNFPDYGGFGPGGPQSNADIFTPEWGHTLHEAVAEADAFINLHLLTDDPRRCVDTYAGSGAGAICFQLDAVPDAPALHDLLGAIRRMGAVASPVIETQGTAARPAISPDAVYARLKPHLAQIHLLTLQAAHTAARSDDPRTAFAADAVRGYLQLLLADPAFDGAVQVQGGITTATVAEAVRCGARFLVAGTQLFRNREGASPAQVIAQMRQSACAINGCDE